jgi:hypothetical protein
VPSNPHPRFQLSRGEFFPCLAASDGFDLCQCFSCGRSLGEQGPDVVRDDRHPSRAGLGIEFNLKPEFAQILRKASV